MIPIFLGSILLLICIVFSTCLILYLCRWGQKRNYVPCMIYSTSHFVVPPDTTTLLLQWWTTTYTVRFSIGSTCNLTDLDITIDGEQLIIRHDSTLIITSDSQHTYVNRKCAYDCALVYHRPNDEYIAFTLPVHTTSTKVPVLIIYSK